MSQTSRDKLIVLAAGGTGGHLFPAEALGRALAAEGYRVALVTDARGRGFHDVPGAEVHRITASTIAGNPLRKAIGAARVLTGYVQARRLLNRLRPAAVVGFGGYPSLPTGYAARHLGVPLVLHEQNAIAGRANRMLAPKAAAIATSFPDIGGLSEADRARAVVTGNPVRQAIAEIGREPYRRPEAGGPLRLLVVGGSQGARAFNELIPEALARLDATLRRRLDISQQVPGNAAAEIRARYDDLGITSTLETFFDDIPARLAAAHLVISRAGASTVTELAAAGRPAIMVPYPYATDQHQLANAQHLANAGGGWVMQQKSLTAYALAERLASLLNNPQALERAARCAAGFAEHDAADRLSAVVIGVIGDGSNGADAKDPVSAAGREEAA